MPMILVYVASAVTFALVVLVIARLFKRYRTPELISYFLFICNMGWMSINIILESRMRPNALVLNPGWMLVLDLSIFLCDAAVVFSVPYMALSIIKYSKRRFFNGFFAQLAVIHFCISLLIPLVNWHFGVKMPDLALNIWFILYFSLTWTSIFFSLVMLLRYYKQHRISDDRVTGLRVLLIKRILIMVGLFFPFLIMDSCWYILQIEKHIVPIGFFMSPIFFLFWNLLSLHLAYPYLKERA